VGLMLRMKAAGMVSRVGKTELGML
jgi:hypothetical protein